MREKLRLVDRMQGFLALSLNHNSSLDDKIRPESAFQLYGFVDQRHSFLSLHPQSQGFQLESQTRLVRRFEQSGPEFPVNLDRRSDDLVGQVTTARQKITAKYAKNQRKESQAIPNWESQVLFFASFAFPCDLRG